MKGIAVVLLCALAAAQANENAVQSTASGRTLAAPGENPWMVHVRMAVYLTGVLRTCAAVLIDHSWALSSASCVHQYSFMWVRFGTVKVARPTVVTETRAGVVHPGYSPITRENDIGLIRINRFLHDIENVAPIAMHRDPSAPLPAVGKFCGFGADEQSRPSEYLSCFEVLLQKNGDHIVAYNVEGLQSTDYDIGAPLVSNGVLIGIRNSWFTGPSAGVFISPANYIDWISSESGIQF